MRADKSRHLIDAAQQRAEQTRTRAMRALRRLDDTGTAVTFEAVAREAGVSRSGSTARPTYEPKSKRSEHAPSRPRRRRQPRSGRLPPTHRYYDVSKQQPNGCASSRTTTGNYARPSPKPSAPPEQPETQVNAHAATRPAGKPRNSSVRADNDHTVTASTTLSTTC